MSVIHCTCGTEGAPEEELRSRIPNFSTTSNIKITRDIKFLQWFCPEREGGYQTHAILHAKQNMISNIGYDIRYDVMYDVRYDIRYYIQSDTSGMIS